MAKTLQEKIEAIVPECFWEIISKDCVAQYLTGGLANPKVHECKVDLAQAMATEQGSGRKTRTIHDLVRIFLDEANAITHNTRAPRALIRLQAAAKDADFNMVRKVEKMVKEHLDLVPIVFVDHSSGHDPAMQALVTTGERLEQGPRIAYDLDDTLTRWPGHFAAMSRDLRARQGFNLVISTRHEPPSSSCRQAVYDRERQDIESTGVVMHALAHSWLDFSLWVKLFPFLDNTRWLDRYIWTKAFYCRIHRIDVLFEDQRRNIERMAELTPDVHVIQVSDDEPPALIDLGLKE